MSRTPKESTLETILGITAGFVIIFLVFDQKWSLFVALGVALSGLFFKNLARLIARWWGYLTRALGFINSRIILSIIFFCVLLPVALLARLTRKSDPLQLKKRTDTYYCDRDHQFGPEDLEKPW